MNRICYGIRRLLLLNSVSYSLGDFPLDRPLSISAPNNRGKSTAINALQFPFLSNMNDMSFPRSNEDTRKYYFPYDNSYVVSEIATETGLYVVGAAGKGQASGYDYQLFAYQSKLGLDDFLVEGDTSTNKQVRNYKELKTYLARRDVWVKPLSPKQMRDALMGKNITLPNDEKFTIGVFRLRSMTDDNYRLFIRVFKNLLHMNTVNLEEMKRLLIDVLLPGEGSNAIDFMARYTILNEEVEQARAKVETTQCIAADVYTLSKARRSRDTAYGVLRALFTPITTVYESRYRQREEEIRKSREQIAAIVPEMDRLKQSQEPLVKIIEGHAVQQDILRRKLEKISGDETRFRLYGSVTQLQEYIDVLQAKVEHLVGELQRTHPDDIREIQLNLQEVTQQIKNMAARMSAIDNNLLSVLTGKFDESEIQIITQLLNRKMLSALPLGQDGVDILDEEQFFKVMREMLCHCQNNFYDDGRVRINLEIVEPIAIADYFNSDIIKANLSRLEKQQSDLMRDVEVARDYEGKQLEKETLRQEIKKKEQDLHDYQMFLAARKTKPEYEQDLDKISATLKTNRAELAAITGRLLAMEKKREVLLADHDRKKAALAALEIKYAQVVPIPDSEPMGEMPDHRLPSGLEEMIDTYILALEEKNGAKEKIRQSLHVIEAGNGLRFTSGRDEETTIDELVEAVAGQDEYRKQLKNCQKAGSQEIGALLKGLTGRLETFIHEIKRFNRQINARKISNMNRIEFVVDDSNDIIRAVKAIVNQDSIFSNPETVHHAVRQLDELVSRKNVTLSLENLFNMGITVELEGGTVSSSFNDANIQSTGTGLTVNIILNVMLLNRLLYIRPGQIVNIPIYIDEAGQIDPANQQTLIDQCLPAGFVPVFASVEAQATAEYWIGLHEVDGRIYVDQNDWFHLSTRKEASAEAHRA